MGYADLGNEKVTEEGKGVRRRSLYKSPEPFVFILCLLTPICSFSNWNNRFLGSKPHQLCGAVTKCAFITLQSGTVVVCKIPTALQKMSLCREPLLTLQPEEDAGGDASRWFPQGEELSLLLRSNTVDLYGKKAWRERNDEEKALHESPTPPRN